MKVKKTETYFNAKNSMEICVYTDLAIYIKFFFPPPQNTIIYMKKPALYHSPLIKQK
jgi:hypothetical protein